MKITSEQIKQSFEFVQEASTLLELTTEEATLDDLTFKVKKNKYKPERDEE